MKHKIRIKKYVMDESLSWEERYRQLEKHHEEESKYLIVLISYLEDEITLSKPHAQAECPKRGMGCGNCRELTGNSW